MKRCVLCNEEFTEWGNNPRPLANSGECCNRCDDLKVVPARLVAAGVEPNRAAEIGAEIYEQRLRRQSEQ